MKKIFYIICIFMANYLFANNTQELTDLYDLYNKKQYKQVYVKTKAYLKQEPLSLDGNLLLGNCAYQLENFDEAMAAYDRVLILEPNHTYAKLQEAKIYIKSKHEDMARLELDALLTKKLTRQQKSEILKLRNSIKATSTPKTTSSKQESVFKGRVSLGLLYDTNPNGYIGSKSFVLPSLNLNYNGTKEDSDFAHYENLYLQANANINESFGLLANFNAYNKSYFDLHKNDLAYLTFNLSPYYTSGDFKIYLPLVLNKVFLEHDSYVNTYGGGIDIKKSIQNGLLEAGYKYLENRYYSTNKDKNSRYHNAYLGLRYIAFEDLLTYMYAKYAHNQEKKDLRTDVNYNSFGFIIGAKKEIASNLMARAKFNFKNYKYKDTNKVFLNKRNDDIFNYNLGLTYNINNSSSVDLDIDFINKKSNQFLYDYDRVLTSINYTYKF